MSRPRFYCENCGAEVSRNAKTCSKCGCSFSSIRCPACGFVGEDGFFEGGCPVCGYTVNRGGGSEPPAKVAAGPLPFWAYVITILALAAVVGALIYFHNP